MTDLNAKARRLISENAREVLDYVTILRPKLERSGAVPETPMAKRERGKSNPPISASCLDLVDANRDEMRLIEPLLAKALKSRAAPRGYRYDVMLRDIQANPGCETRWPEARLEAFSAFCEIVAYRIWSEEPEVRLRVVLRVRGREESVSSYVEAGSDSPASTGRQARKNDVRESYRRIVAQIEALESEGYTREEAKAKMQRDLDCGRTRIREALAFVRDEREDERAANARWLDDERKRRGVA